MHLRRNVQVPSPRVHRNYEMWDEVGKDSLVLRTADFARSKGRISKGRRSRFSEMIAIFKIQCVDIV